MKSYRLTNIANFNLQLISRTVMGKPGIIYTVKPKESIDLYETQMSSDIQLKLKKKLLSSVETERETVISSFKNRARVEVETEQKPPLSARGRKKKII